MSRCGHGSARIRGLGAARGAGVSVGARLGEARGTVFGAVCVAVHSAGACAG